MLDVGQCSFDHGNITSLIHSVNPDVELRRVTSFGEALELVKNEHYDLVLVNRKIHKDYTSGIELIKEIKKDSALKELPVMLVSNLPEAQKEAQESGAVQGFGKNELRREETKNLLSQYLSS